MKKELIEVLGTTIPFYSYKEDDLTFFEYDATACEAPEPMVNTIRALSLLKTKNDRLVGRFFHEPFPLYERIPIVFTHKATELENGDYKVVFQKQD
ncbi:MAG: hypothetical protein U9N33_10355 [Campylobacterota bacterium]|nr:hypothetical protein [Campylobacterota bacterium]